MLDMMIFEDAPKPTVRTDIDSNVEELIEWFRTTYPEREDVTPEELFRAARDYVLVYG